jgi:alpha-tubulin suppressor-like RCC1 family protein
MKNLCRFVCCVLLVSLVACSTYQQNNTQSQQIAVGNSFILRLSPEGTLYVSGGSPSEENRYHEVKILNEKKFKSIDASNSCAAAIDEEGNLYILGSISFTLDETPGIVSDDLASRLIQPIADKIAYVSVGEHHISAISESGKLYVWGNNEHNQLGLSADVTDSYIADPVVVDSIGDISLLKVSNGYLSTIAVTKDGSVFEWGNFNFPADEDGQTIYLGTPTRISLEKQVKIVDADSGFFFDLLLTEDGTVLGRGYNKYGQIMPGGPVFINSFTEIPLPEEMVKISAGHSHALALSKSGNVYVWGSNKYGQLGLPISDSEMPTRLMLGEKVDSLSAGENNSVFLTAGNAIVVTGDNSAYTFGITDENDSAIKSLYITNYIKNEEPGFLVQISSGYSMSAAIDDKKKVYTWGTSWNGCLGSNNVYDIKKPSRITSLMQNCKQIDTVYGVMTILTEDGEIYTCGNNQNYLLGLGHTVSMWEPEKVELPGPVAGFFSGPYATIAQLINGDWYAWGDNQFGSLLTNNTKQYQLPVKISLPYDVKFISSHTTHTLLLDGNGHVYQYGDPLRTMEQSQDPILPFTRIDLPEEAIKIATTYSGCYALGKSGTLYAWGDNTDFHLGLPFKTEYSRPEAVPHCENITDISVSPIFGMALALTNEGRVLTWGYDVLRISGDEILPVPTEVDLPGKISVVVSGDLTAYAVDTSGQIFTWGGVINNSEGQPQRTPIVMPYKFK